MKEHITIDGKIFTVAKGNMRDNVLGNAMLYPRRLTDVYERPSWRKISIYNEWQSFFLKNSVNTSDHFGICSFNAQIFCLSFTLGNLAFKITPTYNWVTNIL